MWLPTLIVRLRSYNTFTHIGESGIYSKLHGCLKLHSYLLRMCTILSFVHVAKKMNEEEERATLENFVDYSILELLLNETENGKDIVHTITR